MTNEERAALRAATEAAIAIWSDETASGARIVTVADAFDHLASPEGVLALLDENDRMRKALRELLHDIEEESDLFENIDLGVWKQARAALSETEGR